MTKEVTNQNKGFQASDATKPLTRTQKAWLNYKRQWILQVFALMGVFFLFVFSYIPMFGLSIAFKHYRVQYGLMGFFTAPNVGFRWFLEFFNDIVFWEVIRNTVVLSVLRLIFIFPLPILFAIVLNELRQVKFKRFVQTVSYLPHFISWVVVSGMIFSFFNTNTGLVNRLFLQWGWIDSPMNILSSAQAFWPMVIIADIWKGLGWSAIIFLAAIAGVDQELYEAAVVDGAGRIRRIWHITLPYMKGTVVILLILNIGGLMHGNFEQSWLLGNSANISRSEIIPTYVMRVGLSQMRFSFATAIGLFQSVIALFLVLVSNFAARKISGTSLI